MNLFDYLAQQKLTAAEFGRRINVSRSTMTRYLTGERPITPERAKLIEEATAGAVTRQELRPDVFGSLDHGTATGAAA